MWLPEDKIQIRKNKIIEVAFRLFCKHGIEQVSMGQIAEQSCIGKRTVYRYFDNKMNLVSDVLICQWERLIDGIRKNIGFYTTYPLLNGCEQIALWLHAFRKIHEDYASLILFSYETKLNVLRNRICFTQKQKDFFVHGIREPCIAALEKGRQDGSLTFSHNSMEVFCVVWASVRGCVALCAENDCYQNTYSIMEKAIMNALYSK